MGISSPDKTDGALLDVRGAANHLGVTESALRHMVERGHVPALRLGGRVYLRRETLNRHLEKLERAWVRSRGNAS